MKWHSYCKKLSARSWIFCYLSDNFSLAKPKACHITLLSHIFCKHQYLCLYAYSNVFDPRSRCLDKDVTHKDLEHFVPWGTLASLVLLWLQWLCKGTCMKHKRLGLHMCTCEHHTNAMTNLSKLRCLPFCKNSNIFRDPDYTQMSLQSQLDLHIRIYTDYFHANHQQHVHTNYSVKYTVILNYKELWTEDFTVIKVT